MKLNTLDKNLDGAHRSRAGVCKPGAIESRKQGPAGSYLAADSSPQSQRRSIREAELNKTWVKQMMKWCSQHMGLSSLTLHLSDLAHCPSNHVASSSTTEVPHASPSFLLTLPLISVFNYVPNNGSRVVSGASFIHSLNSFTH